MSRRILLAVILCLVLPCLAQAQGAALSPVAKANQVVELLDAATAWLGNVSETLLKNLGSWKAYLAKQKEKEECEKLRKVSAEIAGLVAFQTVGTLADIDAYILKPGDAAKWRQVTQSIEETLRRARSIQEAFSKILGSKVAATDEAFEVQGLLEQRVTMLGRVASLPPPKKPKEIESLKALRKKFGEVIQATNTAARSLNTDTRTLAECQ